MLTRLKNWFIKRVFGLPREVLCIREVKGHKGRAFTTGRKYRVAAIRDGWLLLVNDYGGKHWFPFIEGLAGFKSYRYSFHPVGGEA